jgi:hypothetical protein
MTPNQVVAYNVAKARALRGWTQEQAAEALEPYLGTRLSVASFSALERTAWRLDRLKEFDADELLALSRAFDLPIGFFFTPPTPDLDVGLHAADAGVNGLDPIVLLDAVLGRPENLPSWEQELLAYAASEAPTPRTKRIKVNSQPTDLVERLAPLGALRARALLRTAFGEVAGASDVLERVASALRALDDMAADEASAPEPATRATPRSRR